MRLLRYNRQEMQVCLRVQASAYSQLKQYPNRSLLGRSKVIAFSNNHLHFEQRCCLFVETCCLLLKVEIQKSSVLLSRSVFIDHNQQLFMLFSFEGGFEGKLKRLAHGDFINNVIEIYRGLFLQGQGKLQDYDHNFFYESLIDLVHYLAELRDKSEKYYFQSAESRFHVKNSETGLSNPLSLMCKFENSPLFKHYFYLLAASKAVILKPLAEAEHLKSKDIHNTYCQLVFLQKSLTSLLGKAFFLDDLKDCLYSFDKLATHLFKLMQQENCICLNKREQEPKVSASKLYPALDIEFCSNLRRLPSCPKTAGDRSEQSEGNENNSFEGKEGKEQHKREKGLFESIRKFQNEINFRVELGFDVEKKCFVLEAEGVSQWRLDECFYQPVLELWTAFHNAWHGQALEAEGQIQEELKPFRLELLQRNRSIAMRERVTLQSGNLILEVMAIVDRLAMAYLLFQRHFKHFYKVTQNLLLDDQKYYKRISSADYVATLVRLHKQALKQYSLFYRRLGTHSK